jgi:metal-responsive CopG/Arc/MetJ family transcriptional regulator
MNVKATVVRLPQGINERIDAVLDDGEKRADLIRAAVERELKRRERAKG